jgi:ADP-heptose:LPS heptosyltransferase
MKAKQVRRSKKKSVLFVLGGGIGNIVQATPAIKAAAKAYNVDLLLHCNSTLDLEVFRIPAVRNLFINESPKEAYKYQLNGPFTPGKRHAAQKFLKSRIHYAQHIPESNVYFDFILQMGLKSEIPHTEINVGESGPYPKNHETVAIYPGSKYEWSMKRWDKYDELAKHFDNVVLVGTGNDIHSNGKIPWFTKKWNWPANTEIFMGPLQQTAFMISKCKMFIGNDGGLAHIAAATNIPTFIIFGPSSTIKNKPPTSNAKVIANDISCRPCQFRAHPKTKKQIFTPNKADCPYHMKCLRDLSVANVLKQIGHHK